jgi:hypothetical protein
VTLDDLQWASPAMLAVLRILPQELKRHPVAWILARPQTPAVLLLTVEEAMFAGIMTAAEDAFSFRQELLRRAVGDMLPRRTRKALHRQGGEILLNRGESAARAAGNLLQAAQPSDPASLTGLNMAAAQILCSSLQTAVDLALRTLELMPSNDPAVLSRSVTADEAVTAAGRLERAARIVHDALAQPLPAIAEVRLRCALSSKSCASAAGPGAPAPKHG